MIWEYPYFSSKPPCVIHVGIELSGGCANRFVSSSGTEALGTGEVGFRALRGGPRMVHLSQVQQELSMLDVRSSSPLVTIITIIIIIIIVIIKSIGNGFSTVFGRTLPL